MTDAVQRRRFAKRWLIAVAIAIVSLVVILFGAYLLVGTDNSPPCGCSPIPSPSASASAT